jgi:hypothetical protein
LAEIFPWVAQEQEVLVKREHASRLAKDIALCKFLTMLIWFRRVLIQDMAVLYTQIPDTPIFKTAPFNLITFREFAATSTAVIHLAEEAARLAFQNLPEHLGSSVNVTGTRRRWRRCKLSSMKWEPSSRRCRFKTYQEGA